MKKKILLMGIVLSLNLLVSACGRVDNGVDTPLLNGTGWQLVAYEGNSVLPGTNPTLIFDNDSRVSGNASCNSFSGGYGIKGGEISFEELMYTAMACMNPAGIMEQESAYMQLLAQAKQYQIEEGQLILFVDEQPALIFVPVE